MIHMNLSDLVLTHIASTSDVTIMVEFLAFFAVAGISISAFSNRFLFGNKDMDSDALFETVEKSIFAFLAFLLAITLGDVRTNFSKAQDSVINESLELRQYIFLLDLQPSVFTQHQKKQLERYVKAVVADEWSSLAQANPLLSGEAEKAIVDLRNSVQKSVQESGMSPYSDNILKSLAKLDGRRAAVLGAYFGALGMVVGLIMILDQPFRGETSISSEPFRRVIEQMAAAR